jgi:hypothetical protein
VPRHVSISYCEHPALLQVSCRPRLSCHVCPSPCAYARKPDSGVCAWRQINVGNRDELVVSSDVALKLYYVEDKGKERKLLQVIHECESAVAKGSRNSYIVFVVSTCVASQ